MENSNLGGSSRGKTSDDLSKKILGGLQGKFTGEETAHWIADVNKEPTAAVTKTHSEPVHLSSVAFLDRLFDDFQRYAFELTNAETSDKRHVVITRPVAPAAATQPTESLVIFQGTLVTEPWALVMQAQAQKIHAYIVPIENLSTFAGRESFFSSYMDLDANFEDGETVWKVDGQLILDSMLSYLSKKLFGILIRVANGTALPAERFSMDENSKEALNLTDSLAQSRRGTLAGYDNFTAVVDHEVNNLSAIAMKAIAVLDKDHAREVVLRTNHLKMWREKLLALGDELKQIMTE
ncbi:MAG: hypothetical protein DKT66_06625 [Candidatus Melainabacteria bacterium]|nr:MAG: hypothetical protein DKT66_06625 [Candidatus Melainabacteria bacterium]